MSRSARREALVLAALDGAWSAHAIERRVLAALDVPIVDARALAAELVRRFEVAPGETSLREALDESVLADEDEIFDDHEREALQLQPERDLPRVARTIVRQRKAVRRFHLPPLAGAVASSFAPTLPRLDTARDAAALVGLPERDVPFFAGSQLRGRRSLKPSHAHYRYRWIAKKSGGLRLLEVPKPRLRAMQRALLDRVLAHVPLHPAAHAFTPGRSARTFAAVHAGTRVVVKVDLEDFFAAVGAARVRAIFVALGMPLAVAELFTRLATTHTPASVLGARPSPLANDLQAVARYHREAKRFDRRHLPQGAPSSPRLASLAAYGLDVRLTALARRFDATYARYADDLAFSGDAMLARKPAELVALVTSIANDEGFAVRFDKTRVMRSGGRQELAGLVVNQWPDVSRERYDALRARLHRVALGRDLPTDAEARTRVRHELEGHVAWASGRPHRARKLAALLDAARRRLDASSMVER